MRDIEWPWMAILRFKHCFVLVYLGRRLRLSKIIAWKLIKIYPYYLRRKSSTGILVSGYIRFMWTFCWLLTWAWHNCFYSFYDFTSLLRKCFCGILYFICLFCLWCTLCTILIIIIITIRKGSLERRHQRTVGSRANGRAAVARILAKLKFFRCVRSKSAESSVVGFGRDGRRCRSLRR